MNSKMGKIGLILVFMGSFSYADIIDKCQEKWGTNYKMIKYCVDKQNKAKRDISYLADDDIMRRCTDKWGTNYNMIRYCVDKQAKAKASLGL